MTTTIKEGIRTILTSDSEYLRLLGDPSALPYNTYYRVCTEDPLSDPYVTFWSVETGYNTEMSREIIYGDNLLVFSVFSSNGDYEDIVQRIIFLMHHSSNSYGFRAVLKDITEDAYDATLNRWFKHLRFNFFEGRNII